MKEMTKEEILKLDKQRWDFFYTISEYLDKYCKDNDLCAEHLCDFIGFAFYMRSLFVLNDINTLNDYMIEFQNLMIDYFKKQKEILLT